MVWPGTFFEYVTNLKVENSVSFQFCWKRKKRRNAKKVYEQSILAKRSVNNQRKKSFVRLFPLLPFLSSGATTASSIPCDFCQSSCYSSTIVVKAIHSEDCHYSF